MSKLSEQPSGRIREHLGFDSNQRSGVMMPSQPTKFLLATILSLLTGFIVPIRSFAQVSDTLQDDVRKVLAQHNIIVKGSDHVLGEAQAARNNSITYSSELLQPPGDGYVIITDQIDPDCSAALEKLSAIHHGQIIHCDDFRQLPNNVEQRAQIFRALKEAKPKFVAIAPRIESFTENVVLSFWQMLCNIGGGQINVFPAFVVANDAAGLNRLVAQSNYKDSQGATFSAVTIAQAAPPTDGGNRAVLKASLMSDLFKKEKIPNDTMIVRMNNSDPDRYPELETLGCFDAGADGYVHDFLPAAGKSIAKARLLTLYGHGEPGATCSTKVGAFRQISFQHKVVFCGSCFSCYPPNSDLPPVKRAGDESFFQRATENGAQMFYGHMRLNIGFPLMFVSIESILNGESIGQSYQRVLNVALSHTNVSTRELILAPQQLADKEAISARNNLLVMMIGDPAARPFGH